MLQTKLQKNTNLDKKNGGSLNWKFQVNPIQIVKKKIHSVQEYINS